MANCNLARWIFIQLSYPINGCFDSPAAVCLLAKVTLDDCRKLRVKSNAV